jgi:hypothetical protein
MAKSKANGSMTVQTVVVSKESAKTASEAKSKVPEGFSSGSPDETSTGFRFRQRDPGDFILSTFRSKPVKGGVTLVMGKLKQDDGY